MVAGAADEIVETGALAAEDNDEVAGEVKAVIVGLAAFVEPDDPEVAALEIFKGADEVDDAGDAEVLRGAGAGFDGHGTERCGTALGEEDAVNAGAIGDAEERAEVLRIFDAVEGEDKARRVGVGCRGREEVFKGEKLLRPDESDDALVGGSFRGNGEVFAGLLEDTYAGLAALGDEAFETGVAALAGDKYVIEAALPGLEGFLDRVQAVENIH